MTESFSLSNKYLTASIATLGAELQSLKNAEGAEYLWQGDPEYWTGRSPILFPIIGQLKDDKIDYQGTSYFTPKHGVVRRREFQCIEHQKERIVFSIQSSPETLKEWPFPFKLQVTYSLEKSTLKAHFDVINPSDQTMYYSLGGHPAFLTTESSVIEFEKIEGGYFLLENGLVNDIQRHHTYLKNGKTIELEGEVFSRDALIFKQPKSKRIYLNHTPGGQRVSVDCDGMSWLGIWSKTVESGFVCIEPWQGVADHMDCTGKLEDKIGLNKLAANDKTSFQWTIGLN